VEAPITRTIAAIFFIWAGLLIGVSFVATPAKFLAPSLALAQALDVGRWTFYVLAWIEWGFVSVVAALLVTTRRPGSRLLIFSAVALVTALLAAESFALRPMLDARVLRIMAGESVPPSPLHNVYVGLEGLKALLLLVAGSFTTQWQRDSKST
jgi:hypothetical protein